MKTNLDGGTGILNYDGGMGDTASVSGGEDANTADYEAVKASVRGRSDGEQIVEDMLPSRFAAALGVVIGAAVNAVLKAVDGSGIASDRVQWTRRWADQL